MKNYTSIVIACIVSMALASPAFAANNYDFGSGSESSDTFGKATSSDEPVSLDHMSQNERRNKDAAHLPPPYFYGSGDISTNPSSLYHDNTPSEAGRGFIGGGNADSYTGSNSDTLLFALPSSGFVATTSVTPAYSEPKYYSDGSIGTIFVERTGKTIKVLEGEQITNLRKGAGHFDTTSTWDGNVGLCGHNRGSWPFFAFVKDLQIGDRITYTTLYGTRVYEVYRKEQVSEYDYSMLGNTVDNTLTLITCVINTPELRWVAQCREVQ